jgi:catechol 2,3-dioxygenase-like lactoylglutathione lyase family enzyme
LEFLGVHHVTFIVDDEQQACWFYGQVLGFELKPRPQFRFPGLFYFCGEQELHLLISTKPMVREDLFIRINDNSDITRKFIHRHAALLVSDLDSVRERLRDNGVEILFDASTIDNRQSDPLISNVIEGWIKMYGMPPIFCLDPSGNLLEIIQGSPKSSRRHKE